MKRTAMKRVMVVLVVFCAAMLIDAGGRVNARQQAGGVPSRQVVDSGSFGIFLEGKRIGTETFRVEQGPDVGILRAEIKMDDGKNKTEQSCEMQITPEGNLIRYIWRMISPVKEDAIVEPKDQLLVEHVTAANGEKRDVPYVLPVSTQIFDGNFSSLKEILVWRYLATACASKDGKLQCGSDSIGVLSPRARDSATVKIALAGGEKIKIRGEDVELNKVSMDVGGAQWLIYMDEKYKVIDIGAPAVHSEIVRDPQVQ